MEIKFSNCNVPIWKLKLGTVVSYEILEHTCYVHIAGIETSHDGKVLLTVLIGATHKVVKPEKLIWLEPF